PSASGSTRGIIRGIISTGAARMRRCWSPSARAAQWARSPSDAAALSHWASRPGPLRLKRKRGTWVADVADTLPEPTPTAEHAVRGETWGRPGGAGPCRRACYRQGLALLRQGLALLRQGERAASQALPVLRPSHGP